MQFVIFASNSSFSPMSLLKSPTQNHSWLKFLIIGWKSESQESLKMKWNISFLLENKWKSIIFKIHFKNTGVVACEQTKYFYKCSLQIYWSMIHKKLHIFNVIWWVWTSVYTHYIITIIKVVNISITFQEFVSPCLFF